ncbi:MAG: dihydrolipoamide acetyltransferase family protein [Kiritimatiellae bacterium]|nr:dihydrolipoamide acetyltransferase family protein [Kiritimatiellia bacterium]
MATPVIMPRQGQSVESCIIGKWHKKPGDAVAVGDNLFTYETDKATFDETASVAGTLLAVFFQEGDDVPCLTNVCVIGAPGENADAFAPGGAPAASAQPAAAPASVASAPVAAEPAPAVAPVQPAVAASGAVSPRAKHLAERTGADLRQAQGSGPAGRVIERDVLALVAEGRMATPAAGEHAAGIVGTALGGRVGIADAAAPAAAPAAASAAAPVPPADAAESWTEKHATIRKVIARSMHDSLAKMAQLTLNTSFDATEILAFRKRLKAANEKGLALAETVPTLGDIVLYAVARALLNHPACNAHYDDEKMTYFKHVHLGVAIDTPRGLMVPTLVAADAMSLPEISRQVKALAGDCRKGTISPDLLKGGTFTVTNLGTFGVESFTPVVNPPQTCILGVCGLTTRVREKSDGSVGTYPAMGLSLTLDHRAVDGAPAARFLQELVAALENFTLLLMNGGR